MLCAIRFYRKYLRHAPCCRFYPTCSQYALEAIEKYAINSFSMKNIGRSPMLEILEYIFPLGTRFAYAAIL